MTLDQCVALSLLDNLPRLGLTARLRAHDPELLEVAGMFAAEAVQVRLDAQTAGIYVLGWDDPRFPAGLRTIPDCPPALWYRGRLECFTVPCVAIVGSRTASPVAAETARRLGAGLAARQVAVVSGLARGVDSAAHRGALETGRTIAVLGSGVDRIYPREHEALAAEIAGRGLVLSEYPPGTPPLPPHFPLRNRLISGLSRAVVVIEASENSGSLITAQSALDQGRDVMAVPGNVLSGRNRGGHALIRDGARIVESADDILEELGLGRPAASRQGVQPSDAGQPVTCDDAVAARMEPGEEYDMDMLAQLSGLEPTRLLTRLAALELAGAVRRVGAGRFVRQ